MIHDPEAQPSQPVADGVTQRDPIAWLEARLGALVPPGVPVGLRPSRHRSQGDLSTALPLQLARLQGADPESVAERLRASLQPGPEGLKVVVAAPGFLNVFLAPQAGWKVVVELLSDDCARDWPAGRAFERGAAVLKMAQSRRLWPLDVTQVSAERLTLPQEEKLLRLLLLLRSRVASPRPEEVTHWVRATQHAFHDFYARIPVLSTDAALARARLALLVAVLAALALAEGAAVKDFTCGPSNEAPDKAVQGASPLAMTPIR